MKKIIIISVLVLLLPCIIVLCFYDVTSEHLFFIKNKSIRVLRNKTKQIETIPFEEYIVGVLAGEMPINFDEEALKAQAVASRSYAMKKMIYNKNNNYDVVDTVTNQVYLDDETLRNSWKDNYEKNISKLKKIVSQTKNEYATYNNQVIDAFFFSTSTGVTENSESVFGKSVPYLKSVISTFDEISPLYRIKKEYNLKDFYKKLSIEYKDKINIKYIDISKTGKVSKLLINSKEFNAKVIVEKFNLKSYYFKIEQQNNKIIITTSGYGHGVGMSQYGANGMAKQGYNYKEILKYYYQGIEIKKI